MEILNDFAGKDILEQITILEDIREKKQVEAIPALFALYATPLLDLIVDEMVYHTLFSLLADQDQTIIDGLGHSSKRVQGVCLRQAGQSRVAGAKKPLLELLRATSDDEVKAEIIRSLENYNDPQLKEIFLPYLRHENITVASLAMRALTGLGGDDIRDALIGLINENLETIISSGICDLTTAMATENLSNFQDKEVISFLISHIHNPSPGFRRIVLNCLTAMGASALPALEQCLESGDKDEKIMAVNIIGMIQEKKGADLLLEYMDQKQHLDPNLKFAIYEAFGRITSMRSVIALKDGLEEKDELVLLAVLTGLERQCNPGVVQILKGILDRGDEQSTALVKTLVMVRAKKLFAGIYEHGQHRDLLLDTILASGDQEALALFRAELESMNGELAAADLEKLRGQEKAESTRRVLAADDSKAMLFFYKGAAADLGVTLVTATDGQEALEFMKNDCNLDLLITDMNMPNMDGIELTREVRKCEQWLELPILMASTESETSQRDLARETGVTDFISKPFSKAQLKEKIEEMFGRRK